MVLGPDDLGELLPLLGRWIGAGRVVGARMEENDRAVGRRFEVRNELGDVGCFDVSGPIRIRGEVLEARTLEDVEVISPSRIRVKHSRLGGKGLEEKVGRESERSSSGESLDAGGATFAHAFTLAKG